MRAEAFVPGHISCIFRPYTLETLEETGSKGLGIRLSLGCRASVAERDDDKVVIRINGRESEAEITRGALRKLCPGRGFDIDLIHELPMEQGFGTSASGTYAATLCAASLSGIDPSAAAIESHKAECGMGGGYGDLLAMHSPYPVPIRELPGAPGRYGRVTDSGLSFDNLSLVVFERPLMSGPILTDPVMMERIARAGDESMAMFNSDRSIEGLFAASNRFSEIIGLESPELRSGPKAIWKEGYHAGMSMLGNSIYTDAPMDVLRPMFSKEKLFSCSSYSGPVRVTRTE
ncbi:pantothenate kinase CoaA [methanogenic archaeon mixed culture ISO4-G1]|nr:pantothenate kinase CoaA [methanogenic archaeon mixed culture ISO4-G1]